MLEGITELQGKLKKESEKLNIVINEEIKAAVEEYKKKNIFTRFIYRLITDNQILDKARSVAYRELIEFTDEENKALSLKIFDVKKIVYANPSDENSLFPQCTPQHLGTLEKEVSRKAHEVKQHLSSMLETLTSKLESTSALCNVAFFKGRGDNSFLKNITADLNKLFQPVFAAIQSFTDNLIERVMRYKQNSSIKLSMAIPAQSKIKQLPVKEGSSAEEIQIASQQAAEIDSLIKGLSESEVTIFLKAYPNYKDPFTLDVIKCPVTWKADNRSYERTQILTHIKDQLENNGYGKIQAIFGGEYAALDEKNRTVAVDLPLQDKILADLKLFHQQKALANRGGKSCILESDLAEETNAQVQMAMSSRA